MDRGPTYGDDYAWSGTVSSGGGYVQQGNMQAENINISYTTPGLTQSSQFHEKWDECQQALLLRDPLDDRNGYTTEKGIEVPDSCDWIQAEPCYRQWNDPKTPPQSLWLCGPEGTGKTMLSVYLSKHFERVNPKDCTVLYYFCDGDDRERNSAVGILRGFLYQLVRDKGPDTTGRAQKEVDRERKETQGLREILLKAYREKKDKMFVLETLWRVFQLMIRVLPAGRVVVIVDGAEKCDKKSLELLLKKFIAHSMPNKGSPPSCGASVVNLMILARDTPEELNDEPSGIPCLLLTNSEHYPSGLRAYIEYRVAELARNQGYDDFICDNIRRVLTDGPAEGPRSFLWIKQKTQQIRKTDLSALRQQLNQRPKGLSDIYLQALSSIPDNGKQRCAAIMRWIYGAQRPLKLSELAEALSLDGSYSSIGQVKVDALSEIIKDCEDLLKINVTDNTVSFVHESIPELLSQNKQWSLKYATPLSMFYIEHESVQSTISNTLMAYLYGGCLDDHAFHNPASDSDQSTCEVFRAFLNARMKAYPFLDYCINFLIDHLQTVISEDEVFTWDFFDSSSSSPQRDAWWAAYRSLKVSEYDYQPPKSLPLVHIAAYTGSLSILQYLDHKGLLSVDLEEADGKNTQPCAYAIYEGHADVVELLLDRGAPHTETGVPLILLAAQQGDVEIVRLFLSRGANANTIMPTAYEIRTMFHQLSPLIVYALDFPEDGQTFEEPIEDGETLLHIAATSGQPDLVSLLLESNAEVNTRTTSGLTPLYCAASTGDDESVTNMLKYGADVSGVTSQGWTVLHAAADGGLDLLLVQRLHNLGVDITARNVKGETALHLAACDDDIQVIKYLLDHGAGANTMNCEGWTPLHQALQPHLSHELDVIRVLLENGADSNARYHGGLPPLQMALLSTWGCDTEIIRLLLDYKADIHATNDEKRTALHVAIDYDSMCEMEGLRLLIERGADLYRPDAKGVTPYEMLRDHTNPECGELFKTLAPPPASLVVPTSGAHQAYAIPVHQQDANIHLQPLGYPSEVGFSTQHPWKEQQPRAHSSHDFHQEPYTMSTPGPLQMGGPSQTPVPPAATPQSVLTSLENLSITSSHSLPGPYAVYGHAGVPSEWPQPKADGYPQQPYHSNVQGGFNHQQQYDYAPYPDSDTSATNPILPAQQLYYSSPAAYEQFPASQLSQSQQQGYSASAASATYPDTMSNDSTHVGYENDHDTYIYSQQHTSDTQAQYEGPQLYNNTRQASEPWHSGQT